MKLKADRATLIKALAHVQSVVERRNTIPILANVMIAVRDGKLTHFRFEPDPKGKLAMIAGGS